LTTFLTALQHYQAELDIAESVLSEEEFARLEQWLSVHQLKTNYSMLLLRTAIIVDICKEKLERNDNIVEALNDSGTGGNCGEESGLSGTPGAETNGAMELGNSEGGWEQNGSYCATSGS
jgi:hypothetical protein